jgi:hypothetical protein
MYCHKGHSPMSIARYVTLCKTLDIQSSHILLYSYKALYCVPFLPPPHESLYWEGRCVIILWEIGKVVVHLTRLATKGNNLDGLSLRGNMWILSSFAIFFFWLKMKKWISQIRQWHAQL